VNYELANPNFGLFGFSQLQILELTTIINLKPSPHDSSKTRYEVFHGIKPNMQNIRILPIFSFVMIPSQNIRKGAMTRQLRNIPALYIGPSLSTGMIGCIKAATSVESKKKVMILHTSIFTPATDGGGINVYEHVRNGASKLMEHPIVQQTTDENDNIENDVGSVVYNDRNNDDNEV
jgi:hypothetical protein